MTRPQSRSHRSPPVRLRPLRIAIFGLSIALTMLAAVASVGLAPDPAAARPVAPRTAPDDLGWGVVKVLVGVAQRLDTAGETPDRSDRGADRPQLSPRPPAGSGHGRRIVLDLSAQQVWLVRDGGGVARTYLVSGSRHDNLQPGRFEVYSKSQRATSFDYASTMRWMVRFTQGANAAIGFHDIPRDHSGDPVQTWDRLGTATSAGCVRQRPRDARALWRFAPVGTPVAVVA